MNKFQRWLISRSDLWKPWLVFSLVFMMICFVLITRYGVKLSFGVEECPGPGDNIDCAHCHVIPECCPPQDLVFQLNNGDFVTIPKGFFDDPDNWVTPEDHKKRIDKLIKGTFI